jgi:tight adherence protein C
MILVIVAAVSFGTGLWLLIAGLWPARTTLVIALERLHAPTAVRRSATPSTVGETPLLTAGRWLLRRFKGAGFDDERTLQDLAVVGRPVEVQAGFTVAATFAGTLAGTAWWTVTTAMGTLLPMVVPLWLTLMGAAAGLVAPRLWLRAEAARSRRDFRHALGAYLDVLVLLLAAHEGPEGAMDSAARAGNGPAFVELRRATTRARLSGEPVWDALDELGRRVNVPELREIAAAGGLAGERGAAVRRSLVAKGRALRATTLAGAEADARRRSQAMFAPVVLMGIGFVLFLLYPLISNIQIGP